jgi:glucokinase
VLTLCIDFGGTEIKLGLLEGAHILASRTLTNQGDESDLVEVTTAVRAMLGAAPSIDYVGIAVPGVVDRARRCMVAAQDKYGYLIGWDLVGWAESEFGAPAIIENDARAALIGEVAFGCAAGNRDAVLTTLGTGIGTAAMIDGRLLRGAHDHAGILGGHVTLDLDGPICNCGNVGCAEAIASTWALERTIGDDPEFSEAPYWASRIGHIGIKDLIDNQADAASRTLLDRFVRAWGAAIVTLCHAYDPDVVVVSGGVMRSAGVLLPRLTDYVHGHLWPSSHRPPLVTPSAPEHSVLLGLSALAGDASRTNQTRGTERGND